MNTSEIVNIGLTTVLAITSVVNIYILYNQFNVSNKNKIKQFWFRNSFDNSKIISLKKEFLGIISILNNTSTLNEKLLEYKKIFQRIRMLFDDVGLLDDNVKEQLNNFLYICETECMINSNLTEIEITAMLTIVLKSIYKYELNGYEDFSIQYRKVKD